MVRKRVHLQLIPKDTSRRRTFRSRKNNLLKKAHEFRTLCGVSTCVIIFDPEDPAAPETYPKERNEVVDVIAKYVSTGGKRKMLGLPKFFEDRKKKAESELRKTREENLKSKYPLPRDVIESYSRDQLDSLCNELTAKISRAKNRLGVINSISATTMTSDNNNNSNLGVGLNTMESSSKWPPRLMIDSHVNQLGGEVSWSASNKVNSYVKNRLGGINGISMMTTLDNNKNNNLGVGLNTPSSWPVGRLGPYSHLNQLGGEAACSASNWGNSYMNNFVDLPSTQNYSEIPPIQSQYPQFDVSSLGNPNRIGTNYINPSSGTFCSPPNFLQYKAHNNLFVEPTQTMIMHPQPLMQYMGPTSSSDLAPLPPSTVEWVAEKPAYSHNFDQYNYGVYGNADVASSGPPLLPATRTEGQKEHSSSADMSFQSQFF